MNRTRLSNGSTAGAGTLSLFSDTDHRITDACGVWGEKKMYGKTTMGIVRSAFLIDEAGNIAATGYKISPKNTVPTLEAWLA